MQISEVICTRISHDTIGNIGTVYNALELLEGDYADCFDDIKKMLDYSSRVLTSRMKFFRLAFGLENAELNNQKSVFLSIENYLKTLSGASAKISFEADNTLPEHNRIIMQAVMMLADVMPYGGEIRCCFENEKLWIAATSERGYSDIKIADIKAIVSGSKDFNQNPQYAHILALLEEIKDIYKLKFINIEGPTIIIGKNL